RKLLDSWAGSQKLIFLEEFPYQTSQKTTVYPDGTILHDIRVPLGFWEAKDTADRLEEEIEKKFRRGYPQDNIIFENSERAILYQNRQPVMECAMTDVSALLRLLNLFFSYERQEIAEFRKAVQQFSADLPAVLDALRGKIDAAYRDNAGFREAAGKFLRHAKDTINPSVGEADVREMLIQHILTEEIFTHVFNEGDFHRENNIARELYALEGKFFTGAVKRETLRALEPYYAAIRANAAAINSHSEKQAFLKVIYENFYKVYNPKAADRLGVVYTPNEIVKFMIEGADWLTQKHFGKALIDSSVEILDPATGTGTFITELLQHFAYDKRKLAQKYKNELHANEVAILPYYVANLNIEATYFGITGQYAEFENLCFVDTLDNVAGLGIRAGYQHDMFAGLSDENIERVKRQNKRKISVIIGNPPYNANQQNENDNNKNREYKRIDELIKSSYIRLSTAQKTKVYDMYARFFRWASDRLHDDGVVAFITNRSFIDSRTFDGFRRAVLEEFNEIYVMDLGGDVRANPKLSGTKNNVFGIQTGVAISFMVKRHRQKGCKVFYARRPEYDTKEDKLSFLAGIKASDISWERIEPDKNANWINLTDNDWDDLIPVADKKTKVAKGKAQERAIFRLFSLGVSTNRDQWMVSEEDETLLAKMAYLHSRYEFAREHGDALGSDVKNSRNLTRRLRSGLRGKVSRSAIADTLYRPFVKRRIHNSELYIDERGSWSYTFPKGRENRCLALLRGERQSFSLVAASAVPNLNLYSADPASYLPRYRYTAAGERIDNITDWALKEFQRAYGPFGTAASRPAQDDDRGTPAPAGEDGAAERVISPLVGEMGGSPEGGAVPQASPANIALANREGGRSTLPPSALPDISPTRGEISLHRRPAPTSGEISRPQRGRSLTKDDIFHYVYGVLHDPVYREKYALNLKREFPRIPFYPDFWRWAGWGERLMKLHIGYEEVEPWPLERFDTPDERAMAAGIS
ncbi:MAG: type ISP restriction/modification enzyme, partial [Rhizobiaceae bacterium]